MIKRVGFAGVALVVMLALSGLGASAASASFCALVSAFRNAEKAGNWPTVNNLTGQCQGPEQAKLTARWVLVETLEQRTVENLFCAKLLLSVGEGERENGYFREEKCQGGVLPVAQRNRSDYTEVIIPLPVLSITLCEPSCNKSYPLHLNYLSNTVKTELQSTAGSVLKGEGLHVLYLNGEPSPLGTFRALFLKVERAAGEKCFNKGEEPNGEVLTEGSFHIVYTSLAGSSQGLQLGILYLVTELNEAHGNIIQCVKSGIDVEVRGSVIGTLNLSGTTENTQLTGIKTVLNGKNGKQSFRAYWNDQGTALLAQLLSSVGAGFLESNQIVEGEPNPTALEGKMFVIYNR
jgi:hypothetical protein